MINFLKIFNLHPQNTTLNESRIGNIYIKGGGFFYCGFSVRGFYPCANTLCTKKIRSSNTMFIIIHRLCLHFDNLCQNGIPKGLKKSNNKLNGLYKRQNTRSFSWSLNVSKIMGKCIGNMITSRYEGRCYNLLVCNKEFILNKDNIILL